LNALEANLRSPLSDVGTPSNKVDSFSTAPQSMSPALIQLQESLEKTIRTEAESASRRANEVEKQVAEVRRDVGNLRNALREVRELAEGAHKKAESTEAHLGRVARLEAEVSALITAPVVPAPAPPITPPSVVPIASAPAAASPASAVAPPPSGWNSAIVPDFPKLFEDFKNKTFTLLWRGSRDGLRPSEFHSHCDRHANTLTVILSTKGSIFGGFTPVEWQPRPPVSQSGVGFLRRPPRDPNDDYKGDPSLKSFLFTLKNPHNFPVRRFALKAEKKDQAIGCWGGGPHFLDIGLCYDFRAHNTSFNQPLYQNLPGAVNHTYNFGSQYTNDTGLDGSIFFTGSPYFRVKEIEVFEIVDSQAGQVLLSGIGTWHNLGLPSRKLESRAFWDFPAIFDEFRAKQCTLLWRGSRDGFNHKDFHSRCDGHANTLTVILDMDGNIFGGFTPVKWESLVWNRKNGSESNCLKSDPSLKSFIFTLKNPHNVPVRRFALNTEKKNEAIGCDSERGPDFNDLAVRSYGPFGSFGSFGLSYTNDTGLHGETFFTGSENFQVKEVEVFEITN
jgi:hypothetical protein